MSNNSISSTMIIRTVIGAVIVTLVTALVVWGQSTSDKVATHDKEIAVQKEAMTSVKENIAEIKASTRRIEDKLDDQRRNP